MDKLGIVQEITKLSKYGGLVLIFIFLLLILIDETVYGEFIEDTVRDAVKEGLRKLKEEVR